MNRHRKKLVLVILFGITIFAFRFLMGLSKFYSHDEFQIYLIGLQSYTTGIYPYFGPDVVYTQSQIPGAMQGLLISWPLQWFKIPEGPFILLNVITFIALVFFAWYLSKRVSNVPEWFTYVWILTCPWTLHYSAHIENPSYVIVGAILFFIAIMELGGFYQTRLIRSNLLFLFLGFSIFWVMQLHMSWALTLPYLLWVLWVNRKDGKLLLKGSVYFMIGSAFSISALIPTLLKGFTSGGVENNIVFNVKNILEIPNIFLRFLSFASYEIPRFIGSDTQSRIDFLSAHIWTVPVILILFLVGLFQVFYFIICFFRKNDAEEWEKVKWFSLITLLFVSFSFLFSVKEPRSHTFYVLFPMAMWYSFYCYGNLFKRRIRLFAIIFLISGFIFQVSLFIDRYDKQSLFAHRDAVVKAMLAMDYTLLGVRRESKLMLSNREPIWRKRVAASHPVRATGFEVKNGWFKPQNLVSNVKHQGNFSCKTDSIQPYGAMYLEPVWSLNNPRKVTVSFWAKSDHIEDFQLVYEIRGMKDKIWNSEQLTQNNALIDHWHFVRLELDLPAISSENSTFVIYFWMAMKSKSILYVDDLELVFS
ncbi:MAG: hypothetical protein Q8M08_03665 [Bacteroidales bacterium]|nr:hypothetical protein [Bacteroidales bacterium]